MAQFGRGHDGWVGDVHAMVYLVAFFQAAQNCDGGFHRRLAHQNLLKTALQRRVFFNVFAVLV